eukprot:scaffold119462_cov24-Tisochrysis_lutea.AAC.1
MQQHSVPWAAQALANSAFGSATTSSITLSSTFDRQLGDRATGALSGGRGGALGSFGGASSSGVKGVDPGNVRALGEPSEFQPAEVSRCLSAACAVLLGVYADIHGRHLSLMVRRSVAATPWLHHKVLGQRNVAATLWLHHK